MISLGLGDEDKGFVARQRSGFLKLVLIAIQYPICF
jgi:hypothetical protein